MDNRRGYRKAQRRRPFLSSATLLGVGFFVVCVISFYIGKYRREALRSSGSSLTRSTSNAVSSSSSSSPSPLSAKYRGPKIKIFLAALDTPIALKQRQDLFAHGAAIDPIISDINKQKELVQSTNCDKGRALERFEQLVQAGHQHLAQELWKFCALYHYGGAYLDSESPLVDTLDSLLGLKENIAVLNDPTFPLSIHGSFFLLRQAKSKIAYGMIEVLTTTSFNILTSSPLLVSRTLYDLVASETASSSLHPGANGGDWFFLQQHCTIDPFRRKDATSVSTFAFNTYRLAHHCPEAYGFCCSVSNTEKQAMVVMTKHPLLPYQVLPSPAELPKPLNAEAGHYDEEDLPYIATLHEKKNERPTDPLLTPNFFEILMQSDCLPSDKKCSDCLRDKKGANCQKCQSACPCYCKTLCHIPVEEKFISKELTISPPLYARDPSRLVPRIVHQTWFEDVTPEKYPNMSRLIESFKQSGWEYNFYTDDEAGNFLSTHFPPEVREAYEALRPGAFKADLFRYCVLLIHGGVYADMDIMLEANLDLAVGPDVGFMVPQDEPGSPVDRRMCLWNGLIAAAPGHPFLAKTIETVVNNVRNRFTSVDVDNMFCPDPELSILHAFDTLFTAGPCILGTVVNKVLGRNLQTAFHAGEIDAWAAGREKAAERGTNFVIGVDSKPSSRIPGRTVILHQNKWDMGSHRFTFLEKNMVVAATDLPDADDRENQENPPVHYSKTHVKAGIYGLDKLYVDNVRANEEIRFYIDAHASTQRTSAVQ